MRFIKEINPETKKLLKRIYKQSKKHQVRQRAHAILLSEEGKSINELISIFKVTRKTIYNWFKAWSNSQITGLYNQKGYGAIDTIYVLSS